jgi:hypothetical protein
MWKRRKINGRFLEMEKIKKCKWWKKGEKSNMR